jgi:hypothetical protein
MSNKKHLLRTLGLALMAVMAFGAIAVASAQATITEAGHWKVAGTKLAEGTTNGKGVNANLKAGTTATLKGELLSIKVKITAGTLSATEGLIYNAPKAHDEGFLNFGSLTVVEPAGCTAVGTSGASTITTTKLTSQLVDHSTSTHAYDKFFTETVEGEPEAIAKVKLTGAKCLIAGTYPVKGTVYGEGNVWGTEIAEQPLVFSPAINATLGGSLTLGPNPATFEAEVINTLTGGGIFGAETN